MAHRFSAQSFDPAKYEAVKKQQDALKERCKGILRVARICPYCDHRVNDVAKGDHGYSFAKCPNCREEVVFPPIHFRLAMG
jgi:hypothetical protein